MPNVKLEVIKQGPYIKAPDFCPYKEIIPNTIIHPGGESAGNGMGVATLYVEHLEGTYNIIHPIICTACKYCTFLPNIEGNFTEDLSIQDYETEVFIKYLIEFNSKIANDILTQHKYLLSKYRTPIAMFISPSILSQILEYAGVQEKRKLSIQSIVFYKEQPLCTIMGCPVYVSRKLSIPVQVVGEVKWK